MGTHPIFESDFDCLTEWRQSIKMIKNKKKWKFWGKKPVSFELNGIKYYLGSDVANYLRLFRSKLYSQFPKLKIRKTNLEESLSIYKQTGEDHHLNIGEGVIIVDWNQTEIIFTTG